MRYNDFNRCEPLARKLALLLSNIGHEPTVVYGAFHPAKPITMWDERNQKIYEQELHSRRPFMGFVHFWVEYNNLILDNAAEQFGELPNLMLNMPDYRYEKFGIVTIEGDKIPLPNKPKIIWQFREIPA